MRLPDLGAFARAAFFALLPAVAVGGAMGLPLLLSLGGVASFRFSLLRQVLEKTPLAIWLLLCFTAWTTASALWSPNAGSLQWLKFAILVLLGLVFAAAARNPRALTLSGAQAALLVIAPLLAVEILFGMPLNRAGQPDTDLFELSRNLSRATSVLTTVTWAAAAGLLALGGAIRVVCAIGTLAITGAVVAIQPEQTANWLGYGVGLTAFAFALIAPRFALIAVTGGLAAWVLAAPFVTPLALGDPALLDTLPYSWAARIGIWDFVCAEIMKAPLIGHGIDAARLVEQTMVIQGVESSAVPAHPHSASLQIWFETGAVGAALAAAALIVGGWTLAHKLRGQRAALAGVAAAFASLGLSANLSYSLWQEWWTATLLLAGALLVAVAKPSHEA